MSKEKDVYKETHILIFSEEEIILHIEEDSKVKRFFKCYYTERIFKNQVFTLYVLKAQYRDWYRLKPVFFGIIHCSTIENGERVRTSFQQC